MKKTVAMFIFLALAAGIPSSWGYDYKLPELTPSEAKQIAEMTENQKKYFEVWFALNFSRGAEFVVDAIRHNRKLAPNALEDSAEAAGKKTLVNIWGK